jgi:hypothetical protein
LGQWILIDLSFGSTSWISQQNTLVAEQNHYTMPTLLDTKAEISVIPCRLEPDKRFGRM